MSPSASKIPVRRAGAPGQAWLELRGSILLFHKQTWVSSSSMYIPVEWVEISEGRRRDIHYLWQGLLGCLVAFLLAMPLSLLLFFVRERQLVDIVLIVGLSALFLLMLISGVASLILFPKAHPTIILTIQGEFHAVVITLWNPARGGAALRELLEALRTTRERFRTAAPYPVRINHMWHRSRPYRRALVLGTGISALLALGLAVPALAQALGRDVGFSYLAFAVLAIPPLFFTAVETVRMGWPWGRNRMYRAAARACEQGRLDTATARLESLLQAAPEMDAARVLFIRVLAEQGEFDAALRQCAHLEKRHPGAASSLQANLWAIRRIHERMRPLA